MIIAKYTITASFCLLLGACGVTGSPPPTSTSSATLKCATLQVRLAGDPIGSAFILIYEGRSFIVTAGHVLRGQETAKVTIHSECMASPILAKDVKYSPTTDAAIIIPTNIEQLAGLPIRNTTAAWGEPILAPNFANLTKGSIKFNRKTIPSVGRIVGTEDTTLLLTLDVIQKGSSGAPIVDQKNQVLGILTNRILIDGNYTGVAYGVNSSALVSHINSLLGNAK